MSQRNVLTIGLTGGIASGKTRVAERFADLGVPVIDTDVIARDLTRSGSDALAAIHDAFGPDSMDHQGKLRRDWLRRRIFRDPRAREVLERILHPLIRAEVARQRTRITAPYCIVAAPLLFEAGFDENVDRVLVVDTEPDIQLARLMERDGVTEEDARAALSAQLDATERRARADDIIENNADLSALDAQVRALHRRFLSLSAGDAGKTML